MIGRAILFFGCASCSALIEPATFGGEADAGARDAGFDASANDGGADAACRCVEPAPYCNAEGRCVECVDGSHCDDRDPCTVDSCDAGACSHVPNPECVAGVIGGGSHSCAVKGDGTVLCWGANAFGQLGDATTEPRLVPTPVMLLSDAVELTAGNNHTCARREGGAVACWGRNNVGQLGDGMMPMTDRLTPVPVAGLTDAVELAATPVLGGNYTCARRAGGSVACWGMNPLDGMATNRPAPVPGLVGAAEIAGGYDHVCVRRESGTIACWGANGHGELGNGGTAMREGPVDVMGVSDAVELSLGLYFSCARRAGGTVVCWGEGPLGDATIDSSPLPIEVSGLANAVELAAAEAHVCARQQSGTVVCWGENEFGSLGDWTMTDRRTPVSVGGLSDGIGVVSGSRHTCARRVAGDVACWGWNVAGQLGDRSMTSRAMPVGVMEL
jgi:alpha-tubulin suppressor-like RCC1 family protein